MHLADLQSRVRVALTTTIVDEWSLLSTADGTSRPTERAVAFHLGWHLRPMIERTWDIDCEYNRSGVALEAAVALDDGEGRKIPDLIVHHRGKLGPEHNLLLLELATCTPDGDTTGLIRARALQNRFGYRYAAVLNLRLADEDQQNGTTDPEILPIRPLTPHWQWSTLEEGLVEQDTVYPDDVLDEIVRRATRAGSR